METLQTTTKKESNNLIYKTNIVKGDKHYFITIRLNDECKNGHQDFAITGDIYEAGKPKIDRYNLGGGAIGDTIAKHFPQFAIFNSLHLCDYKGIPMHPTANGLYHLREGFNNVSPDSQEFLIKYCDYYRINTQQFAELKKCRNEVQFYQKLVSLKILDQWEREAKEAIGILEELTDTKFIVDSKRTQLNVPTPEQLEEEKERQANGYYTPEAEQQREEAKRDGILRKLEAERDKEINKATEEFEVKKQVLFIGGEKALQNCIYYNHSKTLSFNWRGYDKISKDQYNKIKDTILLPDGVKIENKEGRN